MGEFEAVLHAQVAEARRQLTAAREARDYAGVRAYGSRLRYLLDIAAEHRAELTPDEAAAQAAADQRDGA